MEEIELTYDEINLSIKFYYKKGEDEIRHNGDGSGYPGSAPTIDIEEVCLDKNNIISIICQEVLESLRSEILQIKAEN